MSKVIVVTDSTANVPQDLARQLNIPVVPLLLTFQGQTYRDGVDISSSEVYRWLRDPRLEHIPTTPTQGYWA